MDAHKMHQLEIVAGAVVRVQKNFDTFAANFAQELGIIRGWMKAQIDLNPAELNFIQLNGEVEEPPMPTLSPNGQDPLANVNADTALNDFLNSVNLFEDLVQKHEIGISVPNVRIQAHSSSTLAREGGEVIPPSQQGSSRSSGRRGASLVPPPAPSIVDEALVEPSTSARSPKRKKRSEKLKKAYLDAIRKIKKEPGVPEGAVPERRKTVVDERERPWKCTTCKRGFLDKTGLKTHEETHSEVKKYKCKYCKEKFKTRQSKYAHIGTHHREKQTHLPFKCNERGCGYRFKTAKALESHRNEKHIGLKCTECDEVFYKKGALKSHLESKHLICGNKNCGVQFMTEVGLVSHKKKCSIKK